MADRKRILRLRRISSLFVPPATGAAAGLVLWQTLPVVPFLREQLRAAGLHGAAAEAVLALAFVLGCMEGAVILWTFIAGVAGRPGRGEERRRDR